MKSPDAELWQQAAEEEINSLIANKTWDIVPLPKDRKAIGSRWVFKVKRNADGSIERYKARVVAKGFSQRPGVDYMEVFAPTFRMASIRTIIALAAKHDYHLVLFNLVQNLSANSKSPCMVLSNQLDSGIKS